MSPRRITLSDMPAVPWANGRGSTRELVRRVNACGTLSLRLSVAEVVEPGPFSTLPGLDRILVAIDGPGFTLSIDGRAFDVAPLAPIAFPGEAAVAVTAIAAPSRDFNVMTARAHAKTQVSMHAGPFTLPAAGDGFVFVVRGAFTSALDDTPLLADQLLEWGASGGAAATFAGEGCAIVVSLLSSPVLMQS